MTIQERYRALPAPLRQDLEDFLRPYQREGYQCLLVGGCIRDLLLGEIPADYDFATDCPLEVSRTLFDKVIPTGVEQGTVTVLFREHHFEVTRFRKDVQTDGRKAVVAFAETIEEDQIRRDLRINAIAFDPLTGRVYDSQGGLEDFANQRIRFVGQARERIVEDHLRALRYLRMIARLEPLGFSWERAEYEEVMTFFEASHLSLERIYEEFTKVFKQKERSDSFLLRSWSRLGPLASLVENPKLEERMYERTLAMADLLPIAFFALKAGLRSGPELRLPKKMLNMARLLLEYEGQDLSGPVRLKSLLCKAEHMEMSELARGAEFLLGPGLEGRILKILDSKEPLFLKELALKAKDLQQLGAQGKRIGQLQRELLAHLWQHPEDNEPARLRELAKKRIEQGQ